MLFVVREFSLVAGFGNHAFDFGHQVSVLEHALERGAFLTQNTFLTAEGSQKNVQQMGVSTHATGRLFAVTFEFDHAFRAI